MPRNTEVFAPTFNGEGIVRSGDITQGSALRQEPAVSRPSEGHLPVASYLAVPVMSRTGEVLGGLFFGHPQPDMFDARAERIVAAIAVQAAIAIDKARLYRAAQDEILRRAQGRAGLARERARLSSRGLRSAPPSWRQRTPDLCRKRHSALLPRAGSSIWSRASPTTRSTCSTRRAS